MNASDKLKRLHEELGWPPYDRKVGELLLAVVEAAERAEAEPYESGTWWRELGAALAALEEALSPPTGGSP